MANRLARHDVDTGWFDGLRRDVVEGIVPGLLIRQDGNAALRLFRHHEAVVAVELLDKPRINAQAILETLQEGDRLTAVGNRIEIPIQIALPLQVLPATVELACFGAHGSSHQYVTDGFADSGPAPKP